MNAAYNDNGDLSLSPMVTKLDYAGSASNGHMNIAGRLVAAASLYNSAGAVHEDVLLVLLAPFSQLHFRVILACRAVVFLGRWLSTGNCGNRRQLWYRCYGACFFSAD